MTSRGPSNRSELPSSRLRLEPLAALLRVVARRGLEESVIPGDRVRRHVVGHPRLHRDVNEEALAVRPRREPLNRPEADDGLPVLEAPAPPTPPAPPPPPFPP